jgi:hypothetical protein
MPYQPLLTPAQNLAALFYFPCPRLPLLFFLHNISRNGRLNVKTIRSVLSREKLLCSVLFLNAVLFHRYDAEQTSELEIQ